MTGDRVRNISGLMAGVELSQGPGPSSQTGLTPKQSRLLKAKALVEQEKGTSDGQSMAYIARFAAVTLAALITLGESLCWRLRHPHRCLRPVCCRQCARASFHPGSECSSAPGIQGSCHQASAAVLCGMGCHWHWVTHTMTRSTRCPCSAPSQRVRSLSNRSRSMACNCAAA